MTKTRLTIPKAIRDAVLKEFNYRCAICAIDNPQLHHIDETPSNNDPMNLVPLCPNCHLIDQHNPTRTLDPIKLSLFRKFKDPFILRPQFDPLFRRMRFLYEIVKSTDTSALKDQCRELIDFVSEFEMGGFYSSKIGKLLRPPSPPPARSVSIAFGGNFQQAYGKADRIYTEVEYLNQLTLAQAQVIELIVELLRFQNWERRNNEQ